MGVLPIQLKNGITIESLRLSGKEKININLNLEESVSNSNKIVQIDIIDITNNDLIRTVEGLLRIDTEKEFKYIKQGNILNYVLEELSE